MSPKTIPRKGVLVQGGGVQNAHNHTISLNEWKSILNEELRAKSPFFFRFKNFLGIWSMIYLITWPKTDWYALCILTGLNVFECGYDKIGKPQKTYFWLMLLIDDYLNIIFYKRDTNIN